MKYYKIWRLIRESAQKTTAVAFPKSLCKTLTLGLFSYAVEASRAYGLGDWWLNGWMDVVTLFFKSLLLLQFCPILTKVGTDVLCAHIIETVEQIFKILL